MRNGICTRPLSPHCTCGCRQSTRIAVGFLLVCLLAIALAAACQPTDSPASATPTFPTNAPPLRVTPEAIAAQLTRVSSLEEAAQQFAAAIAVDRDAVRVRLNTGECDTCSIVENQQNTSLNGLSIADAIQRVEPGNQVYLVVPRFVCLYDFDGSIFTPRECRHTPL